MTHTMVQWFDSALENSKKNNREITKQSERNPKFHRKSKILQKIWHFQKIWISTMKWKARCISISVQISFKFSPEKRFSSGSMFKFRPASKHRDRPHLLHWEWHPRPQQWCRCQDFQPGNDDGGGDDGDYGGGEKNDREFFLLSIFWPKGIQIPFLMWGVSKIWQIWKLLLPGHSTTVLHPFEKVFFGLPLQQIPSQESKQSQHFRKLGAMGSTFKSFDRHHHRHHNGHHTGHHNHHHNGHHVYI